MLNVQSMMTQSSYSTLELYKEVDSSKKQGDSEVAIVSQANLRDETKQQQRNKRTHEKHNLR